VNLSDHARANREAWGVQAKDYEEIWVARLDGLKERSSPVA